MTLRNKFRVGVLLFGDILALYLALFITLGLRYNEDFYSQFTDIHLLPFSIIFPLWILIFYIAGLYDFRRLRNNIEFLKILSVAVLINTILTVAFFYLIPVFGIAPKTNLFAFLAFFAVLEAYWRRLFNRVTTTAEPLSRIVVVGKGAEAETVMKFLGENPQLGYTVSAWLKEETMPAHLAAIADWKKFIGAHNIDLIVVPAHFKKASDLNKLLYQLLAAGVRVEDLPVFYETVFRRVPLSLLSEEWFLEKIPATNTIYDGLKRAAELAIALVLQIILLPLELLFALFILLTSPGPVIYSQARIGKYGEAFTLYKFRTMRMDAEKDGARWAAEHDDRTTAIGSFLRRSHLDELPQLVNIIKGELSFVGPRPERPEFTGDLSRTVPYYDIRHLVKPGVTGWAQINYRYGASVEDAYEKLQYDIYYLKNRSLILDLAIILKTLKSFFVKS